ncbi:hypothetical protein SDC9_106489 [bioreactor metagenome]|uniref:Uncharacterized protein n=1 Tax=bioreactor metagenome TaxID=1076179 RepID=A0A645B937_9ZZZZ
MDSVHQRMMGQHCHRKTRPSVFRHAPAPRQPHIAVRRLGDRLGHGRIVEPGNAGDEEVFPAVSVLTDCSAVPGRFQRLAPLRQKGFPRKRPVQRTIGIGPVGFCHGAGAAAAAVLHHPVSLDPPPQLRHGVGRRQNLIGKREEKRRAAAF